jgi:hypothetical protein
MIAGNAKLKTHILVVIDKISIGLISKNEKTKIATDPFKTKSKIDSIGMREAIKYILVIPAIAFQYEISIVKMRIKK